MQYKPVKSPWRPSSTGFSLAHCSHLCSHLEVKAGIFHLFRTTAGRGFCHSSAARPAPKAHFSSAWPAGSPACNRFSLGPFSGHGTFPQHFKAPAVSAGPPHMRQTFFLFGYSFMPHLCLPDCPCSASSITSEVFAFPAPYRASGWRRKRLLSQVPRLRRGPP